MNTNESTIATIENDAEVFQSNQNIPAGNADTLVARANECFERGDLKGMRLLLKRARTLAPYDPGVALALGHSELNLGNLEPALAAYTEAGELQSDFATAQSCRALVLQLLGRSGDASIAASRALSKDASDPVALKVLARIHLDAGRASMARVMVEKILASIPHDADALRMLDQAKALQVTALQAPKSAPTLLSPGALADASPGTANPYTQMQKTQYERDADLMNQENHMFHNSNQDYWDILVADTESNFRDKVGLDFGCGCGRNVMNLWMRFRRMDGADISSGNLRHARENLIKCGCPPERFQLHETSGVNLSGLKTDEYDFIMSTIVLQHIAVHEIRYGYMEEFFRVMKPGGLLSFQMGFGEGYGKADYYENHYHASGTNSLHDTKVTDPEQIAGDLRKIGFVNIRHVIRPRYSDGHPNWIFVKAEKPGPSVLKPLRAAAALVKPAEMADLRKPATRLPFLAIFADKPEFKELSSAKVSYQMAQFLHLDRQTRTVWKNSPRWSDSERFSTFEAGFNGKLDAAVVFDEFSLLNDAQFSRMRWDTEALLVYVSHDFWCHPLRVAEKLRQFKNVLMVLRHETALELFDRLLPGVPKVVQRPGVETTIFHPNSGKKDYDVLLGGSETPDYPLRQRINRLVRENAVKLNWKVLDLTAAGLMSNPPGAQSEYSVALAASKVSPTASNRGGSQGAKLVTQYFDLSPARAQFEHEFYGLKTPEISVESIDTAGITPRYLESFATKSFLIADLPSNDSQEWYRDKMGVICPDMADSAIVGMIDYWVRNDTERNAICERAWQAVQAGETSEHKAAELLEIIQAQL